jgi:glycosyltransferase involved in cell wall biosynthesis
MSKLVILPSENSHSTFKLSWLRFLNHRKINLMFDDEVIDNSHMGERKYVSYIGTVAEDHAFLEFIKLVELVCNNNLLPNVTFLVCTKSQVPNECSAAVERCVGQGRLKVVSGNVMTNGEINYFYSQSFIVWNAYKRSMQSGVLPKAYMFGVPVITSLAGSSEYFISDSTGLAISSDYKLDDFVDAISSILNSFPKYSLCARAYFLENFYYKALSGQFLKGLNS